MCLRKRFRILFVDKTMSDRSAVTKPFETVITAVDIITAEDMFYCQMGSNVRILSINEISDDIILC